jgi:hypothetical protein
MFKKEKKIKYHFLFQQRDTLVENPGEGLAQVFDKITWGEGGHGGQGFRENCLGNPPILGFIAFIAFNKCMFIY